VLGRPARFSADPKVDAFAEERLRKAAEVSGFTSVRFVIEPIAAALAYEARRSRWPVRWLTVQAAFQVDAEVPLASDAKPAAGLGPRLTLQARPRSGLVFTASGARTTRFPSLRERFSEGMGFREPNPSLGPESAWTATVEGRWTPSESLELLLFGSHSEVSGLINTVTLSTGLTQLQNLERAQLRSVA
jgi:outer membrane receptor protein involved in Fe transport